MNIAKKIAKQAITGIKPEAKNVLSSIKDQVIGTTSNSEIKEETDPNIDAQKLKDKSESKRALGQLENEMEQFRKERERKEMERKQMHEQEASEKKNAEEQSVILDVPVSTAKGPNVAKNAEMGKKKH